MFTVILALVGLIIDILIVGCIGFAILAIPIALIAKFFTWLFRLREDS